MYYITDKKKLKEYLSKVSIKNLFLFGRNKDIFNAILNCFDSAGCDYNEINKRQNYLNKVLWENNTNKITTVFSGSEFKVLQILLGNIWADKFKKVWDKSTEYIYTVGYDRRSFRTKSYDVLHLSSAVSKLGGMLNLVANDFTFEKYFTSGDKTFEYNPVIPDLIALEIDEGNRQVIDRLHKIIYEENSAGLITREIIKGILMSHTMEAHKWVGDLLIAAKLQEGLRQVIVECMDESSKEGFLYILKIILDYDLIRFSSIVRALDVWTGLCISAQKTAVVKKCLEAGYRCLTDSLYIQDCLKSSDTMLIYMGLWSIAFDEVMLTDGPVRTLFNSKDKYKKLTALFFLKQTQFAKYQYWLSVPLIDDPDLEVKAWVLVNLLSDADRTSILADNRYLLNKYKNIEGVCDLKELFVKLKNILNNMQKKEVVFKESVFPWWHISITCDEIIVKMLLCIADSMTDNNIDFMLDYREKMSAETRGVFITAFLNNPNTNKQKTAIVEFLGDKSSYIRKIVQKTVEKLTLLQDEYIIIEDLLAYKSGDLRKNAISLLLHQSPKELLGSVKRLVEEKNENKHLAALEIISAIEGDPKYGSIIQESRKLASQLSETSQKTKIMVDKITNTESTAYTMANGFGLFNISQEADIPRIQCTDGFSPKDIFSSDLNEILSVLTSLSNIINKHKDFEYEVEDWNGAYKKVVLGAEYNIRTIKKRTGLSQAITLDDYPLQEIWRAAAAEYKLTTQALLEILFYYNCGVYIINSSNKEWYDSLIAKLFPIRYNEFNEALKKIPYTGHIYGVLNALLNECPKTEVFSACRNMACFIYKMTLQKYFSEDYEKRSTSHYYYSGYGAYLSDSRAFSFWLNNMRLSVHNDMSFKECFIIGYSFYKASEFKTHGSMQLEDFERAFTLELVDENELFTEICGRPLSAINLRDLTDTGVYANKSLLTCQKLNEVCKIVVDRVVSIELKRGDMTTEVSHLASRIYKCCGIRFFVDILVGAEKDTYIRGYNFAGDDSTKKQIFSHLLKCCYPAEGEDENSLGQLLEHLKVSDKQLIDAAMYSPQWMDIVEKYLKWAGLKSSCWYFHAHVNETFSHEKETIVARYSPITPEDFKNGAFDIDWFNEAYSALGEKRFKVVYDSAKYIAGGGLHKRAQLFADATLGKIDLKHAEDIISEKRNKDYVLCYGLIPLGKNKKEMLHRYEFLHKFLKDSKQFGAQRRESEAKAVSVSLENLARNAGFPDVSRFTWSMETEKISSIQQYLKPVLLDDIEIYINIDENGMASVAAMKDGKLLKDIPAKLKDNSFIKEIKAAQKSLKDQYSRAKTMFERAMELSEVFTLEELQNLSLNPVIYPIIKNLVFKTEEKLGYFRENTLLDIENRKHELNPYDELIIAHPVHLYESGKWAGFQKDIYNNRIIQPFKQVFRELYRPNSDELELRTMSHRYDGHQIQPKKAAALLKGKGWKASYEEGLQKVYYKENIIAQIFAMADWFSPADVEAPTIEGVEFLDRKTGKQLPITDIPKVIFSEIMRDIDLAVSIAHVGGVDPEASLSTIEMRIVLIMEMLRLLKISNVELKGSHGFINGTLGQYTVHLGSGIAHKMASGSLNILPVHSQHRGRLFLPFIDDDPKTAEIITKIVFLAEDSKIKDPMVLHQIRD